MCKSDIIVPFCVFGFGKLWILYLVFHRRSSSWWRITWQPVSPVGQLRSSLLHSLLVRTYKWMSEYFLGIFGGIFFSSVLHSLLVSPFKWMLGYSLRMPFFPPSCTVYLFHYSSESWDILSGIFGKYFFSSFLHSLLGLQQTFVNIVLKSSSHRGFPKHFEWRF